MSARRDGQRPLNLVLAVLCVTQFMLGVDITIAVVASPTIQESLGLSTDQLQWIITAYSLTFGGCLLLGGRLADRFGRYRCYLVGMIGFTVASMGAAIALDGTQLVAFRAAQGLAGAVVAPSALSMVARVFPEGAPRQRAYGAWAASASFGGVTGNLLGGFLTSTLGWRSIFLINVPVGIVAVVGAVLFFPRDDGSRAEGTATLDLPGAVTVTSGLALLIYGLGVAESDGWGAASTWVALGTSAVLLAAFVAIEWRVRDPLLPARLLRRRRAIANPVASLQSMAIGGVVFLSSLFMQQVLGYSAVVTGVAGIPLSLGVTAGAWLGPRAIARWGQRTCAAAGLLAIAVALAWLTRTPTDGDYVTSFLLAYPVVGFGLGMAMVSLLGTVTAGVEPGDQGIVAGIFNMSSQIGSAIGLAVLVTVVSAVTDASGGGIDGYASGIRAAFAIAAAAAATGAALAWTVLRPGAPALPAGAPAEALEDPFSAAVVELAGEGVVDGGSTVALPTER